MGGFADDITVSIWMSSLDEDRGGVVIDMEMESGYGGFIPYAENTEKGVRLHIAGYDEMGKLLKTLSEAISSALPITGTGYPPAEPEWEDENGHLWSTAPLEGERNITCAYCDAGMLISVLIRENKVPEIKDLQKSDAALKQCTEVYLENEPRLI